MRTLYARLALVFVLVVMLSSSMTALDAQVEDEAARNKVITLEWWRLEDQHDYSQMDQYFTEDVVRHSAATTATMPDAVVNNREAYRAFLEGTAAMFPDYHGTQRVVVAEGDIVAFSFIFVGHFPPNGTLLNVPMMGMYRFEDGRIAEIWVEWDNVTWNAQMGPMPDIDPAAERPIESGEDLVGAWAIFVDNYMYRLEFTADYEAWVGARAGAASGSLYYRGAFEADGNRVVFTDATECESTYDAFVTMDAGGAPAALRFELVGEECNANREEGVAGRTLYPFIDD